MKAQLQNELDAIFETFCSQNVSTPRTQLEETIDNHFLSAIKNLDEGKIDVVRVQARNISEMVAKHGTI
jgi:hypothetical protein